MHDLTNLFQTFPFWKGKLLDIIVQVSYMLSGVSKLLDLLPANLHTKWLKLAMKKKF